MNSEKRFIDKDIMKLCYFYAKMIHSNKKGMNNESLNILNNFYNNMNVLESRGRTHSVYWSDTDQDIDIYKKTEKLIHDFYGNREFCGSKHDL